MAEGKRPFGNHYFNTGGGAYPRYMPRPGKVIGLTERINGCLQRSMNGKPLPKDSPQMRAMLDYMAWLSSPVPVGARVAAPVRAHRQHAGPGPDPWPGAVRRSALPAMATMAKAGATPAVTSLSRRWGDHSQHRRRHGAPVQGRCFVKHNMPPAVTREPPLGQQVMPDQDAVDIASYFINQPRPDFANKAKDWPRDPKPKDARY